MLFFEEIKLLHHSSSRYLTATSPTVYAIRLLSAVLAAAHLLFCLTTVTVAEDDPSSRHGGMVDAFDSVPLQFVKDTFDIAGSKEKENGNTPSDSLRHDVDKAMDMFQRSKFRDALDLATGVTKQLNSVQHTPSKFDFAAEILTLELQIANGDYHLARLSTLPTEESEAALTRADAACRYSMAISVGRVLTLNAEFDDASKVLQKAAENAGSVSQANKTALAEIYLGLARAAQDQGEIRKSGGYCEDAERIIKALNLESTRQYARLLLLQSQNDIEGLHLKLATQTLARARSILEQNGCTSTPEFVELQSLQWRIADTRGDNDASLIHASEAVELSGQLFSVNQPIYASCLRRLALSKLAKGDRQAAVQELKTAYAIHDKILGDFHPEIAFDAMACAHVVVNEGPDLAEEYLQRGGAILQKTNCRFGYVAIARIQSGACHSQSQV